jgi:hypothetical protein
VCWSRVHLVGVSISFEKIFYRLPFTPPSLVRHIGPSPPAEAPIAGEVDRLSIKAECAAGGGFRRHPVAPLVIAYPGRRSPRCTRFPRRRRGPRINPGHGGGRRIHPRAAGGTQHRRRGSKLKWGSFRVGGLQARSPRAGLVGLPGEEVLGALQDVSHCSRSLHHEPFSLFCSLILIPSSRCRVEMAD